LGKWIAVLLQFSLVVDMEKGMYGSDDSLVLKDDNMYKACQLANGT